MTWFSDLAGAIGLPAGGTAAALALVYGSIAAEKEARPQAIKDIARVLKNTSWSTGSQPQEFIYKIFCLTFGDRQLTIQFVKRSLIASIIYLIFICVFSYLFQMDPMYRLTLSNITNKEFSLTFVAYYVIMKLVLITLVPDFISIAKARIVVNIVLLVAVDVALSVIIAFLALFIYSVVVDAVYLIEVCESENFQLYDEIQRGLGSAYNSIVDVFLEFTDHSQYSSHTDSELFITSTLLTSVWAVIALISSVVAKLLILFEYTRRGRTWFFEVDKHPIRSIGIVAAGLIFISSMIVTFVRAL
jgi:hypothetical protein